MLFCELDGWVLGACSLGCSWMQFCFSSWPGASGMQFGVLVDVFCELDGRVLGGMQFGLLVDAVLRAGRVLGGMQFEVLVDAVLRA